MHTQRFEHRIHWVRIKARLKLREQFAGDCWNVAHAGHLREYALCTGVVRNRSKSLKLDGAHVLVMRSDCDSVELGSLLSGLLCPMSKPR